VSLKKNVIITINVDLDRNAGARTADPVRSRMLDLIRRTNILAKIGVMVCLTNKETFCSFKKIAPL